MQSQSSPRLTFSVSTSVQDTSFYSSAHGEHRDDWAFHHVMFYALPPKSHGQLNTWVMVVAQSNITNECWRYLWLDPVIEDDSRVTGVNVQLTNSDPPLGTIAEFKLAEKVFRTQDEGEASPHRVHYFHYELMAHLRDGFTQALLLPHTTGNIVQFYLNYMYFLVRSGVIKKADEIRLNDILRTKWM